MSADPLPEPVKWFDGPLVESTAFETAKEARHHDREDALLVTFSKLPLPETYGACDDAKALKLTIREGVSEMYRCAVWKMACDLKDHVRDVDSFYTAATGRVFPDKAPGMPIRYPHFGHNFTAERPDALRLTFLSKEGEGTLRRLLILVGSENPELSYCPSLPLALSLLLHWVLPAEAYAILHAMLDRSRANRYYFKLSPKAEVQMVETFKLLLKSKASKIVKHFAKVNMSIDDLCASWFNSYFLKCFHFHDAIRIFDAFMVEGEKVLLRVGLAILRLLKNEILECDDATSLSSLLEAQSVREKLPIDDVLTEAFSMWLRRKNISKKLGKTEATVDGMDFADYAMEANYYHPKFFPPPDAAPINEMDALWGSLPTRLRIMDGTLVFTTADRGYNLQSLRQYTARAVPVIILVRSGEQVFGAYISCALDSLPTSKYGGTGECFVFTLLPTLAVYKWSGGNDYFVRNELHELYIGGGETGSALCLDSDLRGSSEKCDTFASPPLVEGGGAFDATLIEVYTVAG